jgi:hypothetical protein
MFLSLICLIQRAAAAAAAAAGILALNYQTKIKKLINGSIIKIP